MRHPLDGAVAQLGERVVRNDEVRGSIPLSSTNGQQYPLEQQIEAGMTSFVPTCRVGRHGPLHRLLRFVATVL